MLHPPLTSPKGITQHRTKEEDCRPVPRITPAPSGSYMTVQGMGMQQHSYPSHSMHFVLPPPPPPAASAGLTMDSTMEMAELPGPLRLTRDERDDDEQAMVCLLLGFAPFGDLVLVA